MGKGSMSWEMEPWPVLLQRQGNRTMLKLFIVAILMGLSLHLFFSYYDNTSLPFGLNHSVQDKCDLSAGRWIPNPAGPDYTNVTCSFIEAPQNCMKNGRPDTGYLYWRWKPDDCDLHPFDAAKFLNSMRNKHWALIGDSILRNHAQSLICLLSKAAEPLEVYHDEDYKSRRWWFPSHNFNLSLVWSPFLVKAKISESDDGMSKGAIQLHLDTVDKKWASEYFSFDYIIMSAGQWFLKTAIYWENKTIVGCHYCPGMNISEYGYENAYRKVLYEVFKFAVSSMHRPRIMYRTWTPSHFENGDWSTGGTCKRTHPFKEGEFNGSSVDKVMREIELEEFSKSAKFGLEKGAHVELLDTYPLSLLRPDGHPGPYRTYHPFDKDRNAKVQNDCLHLCLPGPVDYWNDLIMAMVLQA